MSRRSFIVAVAIFLLLTCGGATSALLLVRYEPHPYLQAAVPPGAVRAQRSEEFTRKFSNLFYDINNEQVWYAHFTDEQINSYFEENFVQSGLDARLLPEGISQPRLVIEPNRLRLAFRYGRGFWSTVISVDLRPWVVEKEPNVVALELEGFHAGALPIATQSLLEQVADVGRQNGIDVTWYRHNNGHPVALLRFQADQARPTLQLLAVQLDRGAITVKGRSNEAGPWHGPVPLSDAAALKGHPE
jgi:hypothetical protein